MRTALMLVLLAMTIQSEPAFAASKWSKLADVDKNLAHLRRSGLFPVVTALKCGSIEGAPAIRFSYKFSETMVTYKYAYSTNGKATYEKYAARYLTAKSPVISCSKGNLYYGVQNILK
jgi:hypothetical protein